MSISLKDLVGKRNADMADEEAKTHGNVHVLVSDYERSANGLQVHGTDLATGRDVKIALAGEEKFVQLYTSSNEDKSIRQAYAQRMIANRPGLDEFAAKRGNKAVPEGGVISFSDVRQDYDTNQLYARWPQGMVHIPDGEKALTGMFEVKARVTTAQGKEVKASYINYIDVKNSFDPKAEGNGDPKQAKAALDRVFSGELPGTGAPARTSALVSIKMPDGVGAFALYAPRQSRDEGGTKVYFTPPGVDAALSQPLKGYSAVAGVAVAASVGKSFDSLNLADVDDAKKANLRQLYTAVQQGQIGVVVSPAMQFSPSRFQNNDFFGLKQQQDGTLKQARTASANFLDRGYFEGAVGVRFVSQKTGETVEPVVKAIQSDERLPAKSSDAYVKLDMNAVAEIAVQTVDARLAQRMEAGPKNDHGHDDFGHSGHDLEDDDMGIHDSPSAEF
ncbi:hypothetical protein AA14337_0766 [Acetobacter malorum DSM 14337]|uniref:Uncharacterized protein n=2 Tax=Acetobacter malorum TaxID=178901 RepID=A0ABQ0PP95_9PROT|nr:hypothetical protein AD930_03705 [Acetobacter malorum]GBQ77262.1 hypothetical protein AA14337_0766 [Acetobacter malorum DSM 14337]